MSQHYDIFISYRRNDGFETADAIKERLKNAGYNVFFDLEKLRAGKFNEQLFNVIEGCKDFIVVLPAKEVERLYDDNDWVRIEIEHAIKHKKNIIPVLLRGFEWPKNLPESITELQLYQGVAAGDHNYFDASMEKLKALLKSKRGFSFRRFKTPIILFFSFLLLIGSFWGFKKWQDNKEYAILCKDTVDKMCVCLGEVQNSLTDYESTAKSWNDYVDRLTKIKNLNDTIWLYNDFRNLVKHKMSQNHSIYGDFSLPENDVRMFRKHGIQPEEIKIFFTPGMVDFFEQIDTLYSFMLMRSSPRFYYFNMKMCQERNDDAKRQIQILSDAVYYHFLYIYSQMPDDVHQSFDEIKSTLTKLPDIPTDNKKEYYENLYKKTVNKLAEMVNKDESDLEIQKKALQIVEDNYNALSEMKQNQDIKNDSIEIEATKKRIVARKEILTQTEKELADLLNELDRKYENAMVKFAIKGDEQWMDWGKMVRMSWFANNALQSRMNNAKELNVSFDEIEDGCKYTTSIMFDNVGIWLDNYFEKWNDKDINVKHYVPAAKAFYKSVYDGEIPYNGIIVIAIKDNVEHPFFNVGDIVVERKGEKIVDTDQYFKLKEIEGDDLQKIYRLVDGKWMIISEIPPKSDILVGYAGLTESL